MDKTEPTPFSESDRPIINAETTAVQNTNGSLGTLPVTNVGIALQNEEASYISLQQNIASKPQNHAQPDFFSQPSRPRPVAKIRPLNTEKTGSVDANSGSSVSTSSKSGFREENKESAPSYSEPTNNQNRAEQISVDSLEGQPSKPSEKNTNQQPRKRKYDGKQYRKYYKKNPTFAKRKGKSVIDQLKKNSKENPAFAEGNRIYKRIYKQVKLKTEDLNHAKAMAVDARAAHYQSVTPIQPTLLTLKEEKPSKSTNLSFLEDKGSPEEASKEVKNSFPLLTSTD